MPSIEISERILESISLNRPVSGMMYSRHTATSTLKSVSLSRPSTGGITGTWYFNLRSNGATLWTGASRLAMTSGVSTATKTGLSVPVTQGQVFSLDLEEKGGGVINGPLVLILTYEVDDSVVNGPSSATNNAIALFDGVTGKLLKDSGVTLASLNAMTFKGVIDCSANPNYPAADAGDTYKISVAGKIGGASGTTVKVGDVVICTADGTASGNQATVGSSWALIPAGDDGGSGVVMTVVAGTGITVDSTDPANPEVSVLSAPIPQNSKSADYTAVLGDANSHIFHPAADTTNRTFTIPANSSVAYAIGDTLTFINLSPNDVSIAITTDTMYLAGDGSTGTRTLAQYGVATAVKLDSTAWVISGVGLT